MSIEGIGTVAELPVHKECKYDLFMDRGVSHISQLLQAGLFDCREAIIATRRSIIASLRV